MEISRHIASLQADGEGLAKAAASAGLDAPVPTCPGWQVRDLVRHVSGVHRWATAYVTTGLLRATTKEEDARYFGPAPDDDLLAWFHAGHAALVSALVAADPATPCWTFLAAPTPLAFWARRQAHETAIHRVDAEAAAGAVSPCEAEFAADGIDELVNGFFNRPFGRLVADPPVSLAVTAVDTRDAWTIRIEADRRVVSSGAGDADCTITGAASDLYLLLWNRLSPADAAVDVEGDRKVLDLWRSKAIVSWS